MKMNDYCLMNRHRSITTVSAVKVFAVGAIGIDGINMRAIVTPVSGRSFYVPCECVTTLPDRIDIRLPRRKSFMPNRYIQLKPCTKHGL